jgi:uncharacterized integral membrane protein
VTTIRNLFYVLLGALLAIFIYFNFDQQVVVHFTRNWHTAEMSLALALFGALLLGFVVAALLSLADQIRLRSRLRQMRKTVERLESELTELRRIPLETSKPESSELENTDEEGISLD